MPAVSDSDILSLVLPRPMKINKVLVAVIASIVVIVVAGVVAVSIINCDYM